MTKKTVSIRISEGLEGRPVALLVQEASRYASTIHIESDNRKVNAKSIMGMMSLTLMRGEKVDVIAEGEDESEAIAGLEALLGNDI
jgi:catabolite repression HPr-like protein